MAERDLSLSIFFTHRIFSKVVSTSLSCLKLPGLTFYQPILRDEVLLDSVRIDPAGDWSRNAERMESVVPQVLRQEIAQAEGTVFDPKPCHGGRQFNSLVP